MRAGKPRPFFTMNTITLHLNAPWEEVRARLKEIEHRLTDEDLQYEPGRDAELLERLAVKMNRSPEQIRIWIESVSSNNGIAS